MIELTPPPSAAKDEEAVRGWSGISLDREGAARAHVIGKSLKDRGIAMFVCSDLPRAVETAEIFSKETGAPLLTRTPDLRTWGLGELEGSGLKDSEKIIRYYVLKAPDDKPKGGESFNHFLGRALRKVNQLMEVSINSGVVIAGITHHWVVDLTLHWIEDGAKTNLSLDRSNLFFEKEDPPGTAYDLTLKNNIWSAVKTPMSSKAPFHPGPVIIRHEHTSQN